MPSSIWNVAFVLTIGEILVPAILLLFTLFSNDSISDEFPLNNKFVIPSESPHEESNSKLILYWNPDCVWNFVDWVNASGDTVYEVFDNSGRVRQCRIGTNESKIQEASAVVIVAYCPDHLEFRMPKYRSEDQYWVFHSWESPSFLKSRNSWNQWIHGGYEFNLTMTYSSMSDIHAPIGVIRESHDEVNVKELSQKIDGFVDSFYDRPFDAVWICSDCK